MRGFTRLEGAYGAVLGRLSKGPVRPLESGLCIVGEGRVQVSLADAEGQFQELVRRAEAGEEVVLTRQGRSVIRLVPVEGASDRVKRRDLLHEIRLAASAKATQGPAAAHSQDFLYGDDGMPQ